MPRKIEKIVYAFSELSDEAKKKAVDNHRQDDVDHDWWDCTYEDFLRVCEILGVEVATRPVRLMGGGTSSRPLIQFSGFWSQGDGASFEGCYRGKLDAVEKIKEYAPLDLELHKIAEVLDVDWVAPYNCTARVDITTSGRYSHSNTMRFEFQEYEDSEGEWHEVDDRGKMEAVENQMRNLADWLYSQLEKTYESYTSDEFVAERLASDDFLEFYEDGSDY